MAHGYAARRSLLLTECTNDRAFGRGEGGKIILFVTIDKIAKTCYDWLFWMKHSLRTGVYI